MLGQVMDYWIIGSGADMTRDDVINVTATSLVFFHCTIFILLET